MLKGSLAIAFIALAGSATSARGQGIPSLPRGDTTGAKPGTVMPQRRRVEVAPDSKTATLTKRLCPIPTVRPDSSHLVTMPTTKADSLRLAPMPIAAPGCTPDSTR